MNFLKYTYPKYDGVSSLCLGLGKQISLLTFGLSSSVPHFFLGCNELKKDYITAPKSNVSKVC